jgi:hypothetical protein
MEGGMKKIEGWRTFTVTLIGILALVVGLKLTREEHRKDVFVFFSGALVGLASAYAAKSVGSKAVGGEGLVGGWKNLVTASKPGEPPAGGTP